MELALSGCLDVKYADDAHGLDAAGATLHVLSVFSVFPDWFISAGCV